MMTYNFIVYEFSDEHHFIEKNNALLLVQRGLSVQLYGRKKVKVVPNRNRMSASKEVFWNVDGKTIRAILREHAAAHRVRRRHMYLQEIGPHNLSYPRSV